MRDERDHSRCFTVPARPKPRAEDIPPRLLSRTAPAWSLHPSRQHNHAEPGEQAHREGGHQHTLAQLNHVGARLVRPGRVDFIPGKSGGWPCFRLVSTKGEPGQGGPGSWGKGRDLGFTGGRREGARCSHLYLRRGSEIGFLKGQWILDLHLVHAIRSHQAAAPLWPDGTIRDDRGVVDW